MDKNIGTNITVILNLSFTFIVTVIASKKENTKYLYFLNANLSLKMK